MTGGGWASGPLGDTSRASAIREFGYQMNRLTKASAVSATSPPAAVDGQGVAAVGHLDDLGHADIALLLLEDAFAIDQGTVLSFSPEMIRSGPRSGLSLSTCASVHGLRLAVAAWKSGAPDAGTAKSS